MRQISWCFLGVMALLCLTLAACTPGSPAAGDRPLAEYVDGNGKTGVTGKVVLVETGESLAGAYVNIYPDATSNLLGPSQFISSPTDAQGNYTLELPPGTYYVVARKRQSGRAMGPLSPGDYYSEHQRILTTVVTDKMSVVNLPVAKVKAPMFFKKEMVETQNSTGIRGRLVGQDGKPVAGGFATAYLDQNMRRLPDFASTLSDEEGRFTLYLPEAGTYYLGARIHAWDMPRPGEPYGKLGGDSPQPVVVKKGEFVEGLLIEMVPFSGEYRPGKSRRPL